MRIVIDTIHAGKRLDVVIPVLYETISRSQAKQLIDQQHILLNHRPSKASQIVKAGDFIDCEVPEAKPEDIHAEALPLSILYEDESLIVLNKPANLVVHPGAGNPSGTLVNALLHHCSHLSAIGEASRPGIIHRLDKDTTGCIVAAKTDQAYLSLSKQFKNRNTLKVYLALVAGIPDPQKGRIVAPIGRHKVRRRQMAVVPDGRDAQTDYRVLDTIHGDAVVECTLLTGRTHQIRVHLKHIGHPLRGDLTYAKRAAGHFSRPMLHAWRLGFFHPVTEQWIELTAPLPDDFLSVGIDTPDS